MSVRFDEFIASYIESKTEVFKKYLLAALETKTQSITYLDESLGTPIPSTDIKNCELLTDAQLFMEEIKLTRDGRNRYKQFCLTDLGREIAIQLKAEK